jgi:DNA topoisomerase IA
MAQTDIDIDAALKADQERLTSRKQEIEAELEYINQRLARITAYFGATATPSQITRPPQKDRHPRGFVQATVLKTITEHPQGMTSAELVEELGPQGIGQQSIANALSALVQAQKVIAQGRGGKYLPASAEVPTAPDQPSP